MDDDRNSRTADAIIAVVLELLESRGYDAVQIRTVAGAARVSMATIYKHFHTRDELIVEALRRWMATNAYPGLTAPAPDASVYDELLWVFRQIFEPWERSPRMLDAYHHARNGPGGEHLDLQGFAAVEPIARSTFEKLDPIYAADVGLILENTACAVIVRFAHGELAITDILPVIERTIARLTSDNAALALEAPVPNPEGSASRS